MGSEAEQLAEARADFIAQWGTLGPVWGITRSMAQIHAALLASDDPLSTDELMAQLEISRGNANTHLRDLVSWGLVRPVHRKGDRKEYFEAEKGVWAIFCIIARERRRREIDPALAVLRDCVAKTKSLRSREATVFHDMVAELADFVGTGNRILERAAARQESHVIPALLKLFR